MYLIALYVLVDAVDEIVKCQLDLAIPKWV